MYADWKNQINYTTPNMNGFQATVGISQAWNAWSAAHGDENGLSAVSTGRGQGAPAMDFKASYSFASNDMTGKIWTSATRQRVKGLSSEGGDDSAYAADLGANVNMGSFGLTGYYFDGRGIGQTHQLLDGFASDGQRRDSNGGYIQATYVLPSKTKLGVAWGESNLDRANSNDDLGDTKDELWTIGAYHPLTKHLNLVAEYNHAKHSLRNSNDCDLYDGEQKAKTVSLGAILFF
jgi:phosphate-selective porin